MDYIIYTRCTKSLGRFYIQIRCHRVYVWYNYNQNDMKTIELMNFSLRNVRSRFSEFFVFLFRRFVGIFSTAYLAAQTFDASCNSKFKVESSCKHNSELLTLISTYHIHPALDVVLPALFVVHHRSKRCISRRATERRLLSRNSETTPIIFYSHSKISFVVVVVKYSSS